VKRELFVSSQGRKFDLNTLRNLVASGNETLSHITETSGRDVADAVSNAEVQADDKDDFSLQDAREFLFFDGKISRDAVKTTDLSVLFHSYTKDVVLHLIECDCSNVRRYSAYLIQELSNILDIVLWHYDPLYGNQLTQSTSGVREFLRKSCDRLADCQRQRDIESKWVSQLSDCKSPIEKSFLWECHKCGVDPRCQFPVGPFFLDFAFPDDKICVELDGHDFHKTKEQRTADSQRQRWLELNDWRVIRFTGTEIHHNVASCVQQTIQFIAKVKEQRNGISERSAT